MNDHVLEAIEASQENIKSLGLETTELGQRWLQEDLVFQVVETTLDLIKRVAAENPDNPDVTWTVNRIVLDLNRYWGTE
jgi:hypothetical protein